MKKYFELTVSCEPEIIGVNNGVCQGNIIWKKFKSKKTIADIHEYFSLKRYRTNLSIIETFSFYLEYVEAYKSAKMTDLFLFSPALWGIKFFVTDTTKNLLKKFKLPVHSYIPVKVYHREREYDYWALYIPCFYDANSIDYKKTIFFKGSEIIGKDFIQFKDKEEWYENKVFGAEKLCFNENFDDSFDLFYSSFGGRGYYISEQLKIAIEEARLSGIVIHETKEPELILPA